MLSSARNKYLLARIERTLAHVITSHAAAARRGRVRPLAAELGFGIDTPGEKSLPPLLLHTPEGNEVQLYGKIDRVDLLEDQAAVAVIDYKLRGNKLELERVYHGLSLQLLTYLLVLQANGEQLAGRPLTAAAAFYVRLIRSLEKLKHPDDALPTDDPEFHLREKPRGIIDGSHVGAFDRDWRDGTSDVIHAFRKKDGSIGNKRSSDVADSTEFAALLRFVRLKLGQLADDILAGSIDVRPYRLAQESPCPRCEFRSLCRFDLTFNRYLPLDSLGREEVLARAAQEAGDEG
jgi:ATP-dependent helicase/nuclease subunit B